MREEPDTKLVRLRTEQYDQAVELRDVLREKRANMATIQDAVGEAINRMLKEEGINNDTSA